MSRVYQTKRITAVKTQQHKRIDTKNQGANVQTLEVSGIFLGQPLWINFSSQCRIRYVRLYFLTSLLISPIIFITSFVGVSLSKVM